MELTFEWDEEKDKSNRRKHGVSFDEAKTVFNDPQSITISDEQHSDKEDRYIDIGMSSRGRLTSSRTRIVHQTLALSVAARQPRPNAKHMSKRAKAKTGNDMLPEYDFSGGTRGKHYRDYQRGHTVKINKTDGTTVIQQFKLEDGAVVLAPDVRKYFSDADSVNQALRTLIGLIPKKTRRATGK